jgi:hypothetical protein
MICPATPWTLDEEVTSIFMPPERCDSSDDNGTCASADITVEKQTVPNNSTTIDAINVLKIIML